MRYWIITLLAATATFLMAQVANSRTAYHYHPRCGTVAEQMQWQEPCRYHPCPANVVLANGRHACLGFPD